MHTLQKNIIITTIGLLLGFVSLGNCFVLDKYHVKVKVVDDNGMAVQGADTGISFENMDGRKMTGSRGLSDSLGIFEASGTGNGHITFGATKEGYYRSNYSLNLPQEGKGDQIDKEFNVLLRKIENPVPMYARHIRKEIPYPKQEIGFDLSKADWVAPYGQGVIADFNVYLEADEAGSNDFEYNVKISFGGEYNGYYSHVENINAGNVYKLPRYARLDGYETNIQVFWRGLKRGLKTSWNSNLHYIFRVRTEKKDGKFDRAMYGKIVSDIELRSNRREGKLPSIEFTYYLNPDYTRNLEFDPKRNLFPDLPELERISYP